VSKFKVRFRKKPKTAFGRLLYTLEDKLFLFMITRKKYVHKEEPVPVVPAEVAISKEVLDNGSLNYTFKE
jgi:hypothetical protein